MKPIKSFLTIFYILDHCYDLCKENDLGVFLGMISPEIWANGLPADKSIYIYWINSVKSYKITDSNILAFGTAFLKRYGERLDFDFSQTEEIMQMQITQEIIAEAIRKAEAKCEKHQYIW